MFKKIFSAIIISSFLLSCNQTNVPAEVVKDSAVNIPVDTIETGFMSYVLRDRNKNSAFYNVLEDFDFRHKDEISSSIDYMRKDLGITIQKHKLPQLPSEWVPIVRYKGNYYAYVRHDYPHLGKRKITDSLIYFYDVLDAEPNVYDTIEQLGPEKFRIKTTPKLIEEEITVTIIDRKNKIAIWETKDVKTGVVDYDFYIPKENIRDLPVLANTGELMCFSFKPDSVDYQKLIKGK
jgi:hypothetical protein